MGSIIIAGQEVPVVRLDELPIIDPASGNSVPVMADGDPAQSAIVTILGLITKAHLVGKLLAEDIPFDPTAAGILSMLTAQGALDELATMTVEALAGKADLSGAAFTGSGSVIGDFAVSGVLSQGGVLLSDAYQPKDAQLATLAGLVGAAGSFVRWTGAATAVMQAIVGTVLQSGGNPTGAIIEEGSGANGRYIRFASGMQICINAINFGAGNFTGVGTLADMYRTSPTNWTLPAEFADINYRMIATPRATASGADGFVTVSSGTARTTTSVSGMQAYRGTNSPTGITVDLVAIGRWFL